ncbi:MAG TPA: hypothetical protein VFD43_12860 [Planctomycetota bacterium]|nr:hypothetical protein [Planctomycetota bacterium]
MNPAGTRPRAARIALALLVGALLSAWVARGFFAFPPGQIHATHEGHSYVYRVVEFREALAEGRLSPQWCAHFRGGLGSPYFSYYQPGFFYVASLVPWSLPGTAVLGVAVWIFSLAGFLGLHALLSRWFDPLAGIVGGGLLLLSVYSGTELYVRGDLSEYAAMMALAPLAWAVARSLEEPGPRAWLWVGVLGAALIALHPCISLVAYGLLTAVAAVHLAATRRWRAGLSTLAALAAGAALAAFYWLPVFTEASLVSMDRAFTGFYHHSRNFVDPGQLLGEYTRRTLVPLTLGPLLPALALVNTACLAWRWRAQPGPRRRVLAGLWLLALAAILLMLPVSQPLWDRAPLLPRLQFPWRLLSVTTVALAGLAGPLLWGLPGRIRVPAAVALLAAALWLSREYSATAAPLDYPEIRHAAEIADVAYFAPDLRAEWLPRGSREQLPGGVPRAPAATPGVEVGNFRRGVARLECELDTGNGGRLTLPHYHFPVGWMATLEGEPVSLSPDADGLMVAALPPHRTGTLEVVFGMTPARRRGWILSLVSGLVLIVAAVRARATGAH